MPVLFGIVCHTWPAIKAQKFAIYQFWLYQLGAVLLVAGKYDADGGGDAALAAPGGTLVLLATLWMAVMFWRATATRHAGVAKAPA